ncbi:hypothetical protein ACFSJ3_17205 [Corallincola platygyrae]|uniref:Uncharacterized protein n=1 Tax=Corallincola platygyrae TaxID=1193278 RepID=A0ABW4XQA7_9GAMM
MALLQIAETVGAKPQYSKSHQAWGIQAMYDSDFVMITFSVLALAHLIQVGTDWFDY